VVGAEESCAVRVPRGARGRHGISKAATVPASNTVEDGLNNVTQSLSRTDFRGHTAGSVIAGVQGALPERRYAQSEITEALAALPAFEGCEDVLRKLHASAKVDPGLMMAMGPGFCSELVMLRWR
jgi:hypothetical protein